MKIKNPISQFLILVTFFLINSTATAENYVGLSYADTQYSEKGLPNFDLGAAVGRFGSKANDYVAVELRVGVGVSEDTVEKRVGYNGFSVDAEFELELDKFYGLYLKGGVPVSYSLYPYVVVGFSDVTLDATFETVIDAPFDGYNNHKVSETDSLSENDFSYGVGVDFKLTDRMSLNAEYIKLYEKDDIEISSMSIGLGYSF